MNSYIEIFDKLHWENVSESILSKTDQDVNEALEKKTKRTIEDFKALVSPSADKYLEKMAFMSHQLTRKRFGNTIQLYAPLYVSNECNNLCTYCAFSYDNKIKRVTLNDKQITDEIDFVKKMGFDHLLIVTGEANNSVGMKYFKNLLPLLRKRFSHISFEVQPLKVEEYKELNSLGVNAVMIYQETYNKKHYEKFHLKGRKSNFYNRLETPDRLGKAGMYKIGLGVLLGLGNNDNNVADWRTDSCFCASHLQYLEKKYWQTKYSISFPRLRPIEIAGMTPLKDGEITARKKYILKTFDNGISDRQLVQLICAYRIFNEEVELSLSTRESENFRNNVFKLGITSMSAGSKTNPGGYSSQITISQEVDKPSLQQFEISDERSPEKISEMLKLNGYEPLWKDWDRSLVPQVANYITHLDNQK